MVGDSHLRHRPAGYHRHRRRPIGPARDVFINEAQDIITIAIYSAARWDLGSRSSREQRNLYLDAAVAAIHYGHSKWNPKGPDDNWCIKNGGPGHPQADDVIALCRERDAWDLVLSIGANNWNWRRNASASCRACSSSTRPIRTRCASCPSRRSMKTRDGRRHEAVADFGP